MFRILLCLVVFTVFTAHSSAQLTGQLTDGNATFNQLSTPSSLTSTTMRASFRPEGGATTNSLYDSWMYYRVAGDTRESPFGNYNPTGPRDVLMTGSFVGNTATYNLTDQVSNSTRFTATWTMNLVDSATPNTSTLYHTVTLNNPGATPLTISLFQYVDIDLSNVATGQSATGGINGMYSTDGTLVGSLVAVTPATAFQASPFSDLRTSLSNETVTNLNNTGLPFSPGDVTFAYQWDVTIPAGGSTTIQSYMGVQPVPEPGMVLACCLGLAGVGRLYHKRRKAVA
jgi:hypothetical protein